MAFTVPPFVFTVGAAFFSIAVMTSTSPLPRAVTRAADSGMTLKTTCFVFGALSLSQ